MTPKMGRWLSISVYGLVLLLVLVVINGILQPNTNDALPTQVRIPTRDIYWHTPLPNSEGAVAALPTVVPVQATTNPNAASNQPLGFNAPNSNAIDRSRIQLTLPSSTSESDMSSSDELSLTSQSSSDESSNSDNAGGLNLTPVGSENSGGNQENTDNQNTDNNQGQQNDNQNNTGNVDDNPENGGNQNDNTGNNPNQGGGNDSQDDRNNPSEGGGNQPPRQATDTGGGRPPATPHINPTATPTLTPTPRRNQINLTPNFPTNTPVPTRTPIPTLPPTLTPTLTPTVPPNVDELWVDAQSTNPVENGSEDAPYRSVANAVQAARDGMTIHVRPGLYIGTINFVGKSLTIQGTSQNPDDAVLAGLGLGQPMLTINGGTPVLRGVTLRGLRGLNTGILIEHGTSVLLDQMHFDNLEYGVLVTGQANVRLQNSLATYNHHAVRVETASGSLTAINNLILHSARGIFSNTNTVVQNNTIAMTHIGLEINHDNTIVRFNILWDNTQDIDSNTTLSLDTNIFETGAMGQASDDPLFILGTNGKYYLDPSSPAVDAGWQTADEANLADRSTATDGTLDSGAVDLGYHYDEHLAFTHIPRQIYVDASNNSFQDGSAARPWRKITDAINTTRIGRSGDVLLIQDGEYAENITITKRDLVLRGMGDSVILRALVNGTVITMDTSETVIEGITVHGGNAQNGGAIRIITNDDVSVRRAIIRNNIIEENVAALNGGAIYIVETAPIIEQNIFRDNRATNGSAIAVFNAQNATIRNNLFVDNIGGYAIHVSSTDESSLVVFNTLVSNGGGIRNANGTNRYAYNIAWNNITNNLQDDSGSAIFQNNLVNADASTLAIETTEDPFVDSANDDYRLRIDSAAVDAAADVPTVLVDIIGNPRSLDGNGDGVALPDIGAYELDTTTLVIAPIADALYVDATAADGGTGTSAAPFNTIAAAISAATDGQQIIIYPATYTENLVIDKPLTLTSPTMARESTTITGETGTALTISADDVSLIGLNIADSAVGIAADGFTGLKIRRSLFTGNDIALQVNGEALVVNNIFRDNLQTAIDATGTVTIGFNTIINNTAPDTCDCVAGVHAGSVDVIIEANILYGNTDDFGFLTGQEPTRIYANLIGDGDYDGENFNMRFVPLFGDEATALPGAGSPVIDAIPLAWTPDYDLTDDYYGRSRPVDGNSDEVVQLDIGAVEALPNTSLLEIRVTPTPVIIVPTQAVGATPITIPTLGATIEATLEISTDEPTIEATLDVSSTPTAEATLAVSSTPTAEVTLDASSTPTVEATLDVSSTPTVEATLEPSLTPTLLPSATPLPSSTPTLVPSATPLPSATPTLVPSATSLPSATPTLIPSATPVAG